MTGDAYVVTMRAEHEVLVAKTSVEATATVGFEEVATVAGRPDGAEALALCERFAKNTAESAMKSTRVATNLMFKSFVIIVIEPRSGLFYLAAAVT